MDIFAPMVERAVEGYIVDAKAAGKAPGVPPDRAQAPGDLPRAGARKHAPGRKSSIYIRRERREIKLDTKNNSHALKRRSKPEIRADIKNDLYQLRRNMDELILHLIELNDPDDHQQ